SRCLIFFFKQGAAYVIFTSLEFRRVLFRSVPLEPGRMAETEIMARLILVATGMYGTDPAAVDAMVVEQTLGKAVRVPHSPVHGRDPKELAAQLGGENGPERRLDLMLRLGPYGDGFGARPDGLTLDRLL